MIRLRRSLGLARHLTQIVVTARGIDIDDLLLFNVADVPGIVVTVSAGATAMERALRDRPWIRVIVMADARRLAAAFAALRARGIDRISCIGGRALAHELIEAQLVDDVYMTTAAREGGYGHAPPSSDTAGHRDRPQARHRTRPRRHVRAPLAPREGVVVTAASDADLIRDVIREVSVAMVRTLDAADGPVACPMLALTLDDDHAVFF